MFALVFGLEAGFRDQLGVLQLFSMRRRVMTSRQDPEVRADWNEAKTVGFLHPEHPQFWKKGNILLISWGDIFLEAMRM